MYEKTTKLILTIINISLEYFWHTGSRRIRLFTFSSLDEYIINCINYLI